MKNIQFIIEDILDRVKKRGATFAEVSMLKGPDSLLRIVDGEVYQPTAEEGKTVSLSFVLNGRQVNASLSSLDQIDKVIERAIEDSKHMPATEGFAVPEGKFPTASLPLELTFDAETAELNNERAVEVAMHVRDVVEREGFTFDGVISQGMDEFAIGNSLGTFQQYTGTNARLEIYGFGRNDRKISAYRTVAGTSLSRFSIESLAADVARKCRIQQDFLAKHNGRRINPFTFTGKSVPGVFDVIMEPSCWAGLLAIFSSQAEAWNAKAFHDGMSFFSGKLGQKVMGSNITIWDDPLNPDGIPMPFDFEGYPKQKLLLVEKGIARGVCYDTELAKKHGTVSTGHALPPSMRHCGSMPFHLVVEGGNDSVEDMIAASKEPTIWITTLHYIRSTHNQDGRTTGSTLHGVFLVKDGEVVGPTMELRFDESVPEALSRVTHISPSVPTLSMETDENPYLVPTMRVKNFRFVSVAQSDV